MTTFDSTTPKARKGHRCDWCYGPIPKGEVYSRWSGIFDGEFQSNAMHLECEKARAAEDDGYEEGYMPGEGEMPERVKALR